MHLNHKIEQVIKLIGLSKFKDQRNIEQVMADIAENHHERDYHQLYNLLKDQQIFIPINLNSLPDGIQAGEEYQLDIADKIHIHRILGANDQTLIPAALNSTCNVLKDGFMRMGWISFLTMIYKKPDIEGATLEGENSWVKLGSERIQKILKRYKVELT